MTDKRSADQGWSFLIWPKDTCQILITENGMFGLRRKSPMSSNRISSFSQKYLKYFAIIILGFFRLTKAISSQSNRDWESF